MRAREGVVGMGARWRARAACADLPGDEWFPDRKRTTANPLVTRVCRDCPVRRQCLFFALQRPEIWDGIWAGLMPAEVESYRVRLIAGEPPQEVIAEALNKPNQRRDRRGSRTVYNSASAHLPSRSEMRRTRRAIVRVLRAAGLLDAADEPVRAA